MPGPLGPANEVLERCADFVPQMRHLARVVPPGVDIAAFRPRPRAEALLDVADRLARDPDTERGRPSEADARVEHALEAQDASALDAIAASYDQAVPEPEAAARLRAGGEQHAHRRVLGKLIPQKGVELLLAAHQALAHDAEALIVGFGSHRERLAGRSRWRSGATALAGSDVHGRLDHRHAPGAVAAMDVIVVPSILHEAFGMVAAEGRPRGHFRSSRGIPGSPRSPPPWRARWEGRDCSRSSRGKAPWSASRRASTRCWGFLASSARSSGVAVSGFVERMTWERTASKILAAW